MGLQYWDWAEGLVQRGMTKQTAPDSQQRLMIQHRGMTNMEGQLEAVVPELRGSRKRRRNETDLPVTGGSSTPGRNRQSP